MNTTDTDWASYYCFDDSWESDVDTSDCDWASDYVIFTTYAAPSGGFIFISGDDD
jgi:hypothetical protein